MWLSLLLQLLHYCGQILPEEQISAHQYNDGCSSLLGLSPYGRVPEVQLVNFDLPQIDVYLQSISSKKVCAEILSEITLE